jgi:hypothetical protein
MIRLVLDTTVFHQNPNLKGQGFKLIEMLSKAETLKLYLPYVVEKEFLTQQAASCREEIDKAARALQTLAQRSLPKELGDLLSSVDSELEKNKPALLFSEEQNFNAWLSLIRAERIAVCSEQAVQALDAYFHGKAPLKLAKNRKDIPDSFVFQAIVKLASDDKELVFISADNKIRDAVNTLPNVSTFENLKAFAQSPNIQNLVTQEEEKQKIQIFKDRLPVNQLAIKCFHNTIQSSIGDKVLWKDVDSDGGSDATITSYGSPSEPSLCWEDLSYYGDGNFSLPFVVTMDVIITYYIAKSEWSCMDEDEAPPVTDHNDHYYEAEGEIEVKIDGVLSFSVWNDAVPEDDKIIDTETATIESIEAIEVL